MNRKKLITSLLPLLLLPRAVYCANPADVLRRAGVADKYICYRGLKLATVSSRYGREAAILKVVHMKPGNTRTEYYSPAPIAGIILIQNDSGLWKYRPGEGVWEQIHTHSQPDERDINQGAYKNYNIRLVGTERVAGRPTYVIQALPKRTGEAAHRVWVDKDYYLIIKTQVESPRGAILNSSRFTEIEFNPKDISPTAFKIGNKAKSAARNTAVPFKAAKPKWLPQGYKLVGVSCFTFNGHTSAHLQYSNGVNMISLFERTGEQMKAPQIHGKYTHVYTWTKGNMVYTLIGDVDNADLKKIADSMN